MNADRSLKVHGLGAVVSVLVLAPLVFGPFRVVTVLADTNAQVAAALTSNDVYVSKSLPRPRMSSPAMYSA